MIHMREKATILNVLTQHCAEFEAKKVADEIIAAIYPPEWDDTETLEDCYSCGAKGHIIVRVEHPKSNSTSSYDVLCGRCFGTGKLPKPVQERY